MSAIKSKLKGALMYFNFDILSISQQIAFGGVLFPQNIFMLACAAGCLLRFVAGKTALRHNLAKWQSIKVCVY